MNVPPQPPTPPDATERSDTPVAEYLDSWFTVTCQGVLLDSDGVLVDSHDLVVEAWSEIAQIHDLDIDRLLRELVGVRANDTLSHHLPEPLASQAVKHLEEIEVESADETPALAGARELVDRLPLDRYAIVTSASHRLASARWAGAGIRVPPVVVTADDVSRGKPDPEPFVTGAARLGIAPGACVVFEDSPSGGRAARAAGTIVIAVGRQPWDVEPAARIADLSAVSVGVGDRTGDLVLHLYGLID